MPVRRFSGALCACLGGRGRAVGSIAAAYRQRLNTFKGSGPISIQP
jgi:hypothetical protein